MMTNTLPPQVTIDAVTEEFLALQQEHSSPTEFDLYSQVLRFFKLSINGHAHTKLDKNERTYFQQYLVPGKGYSRTLSTLFGPEKMPAEVKYFFRRFLGKYAYVGDEFERRAPGILKEFFAWMVHEKHIPELDIQKLFPKQKTKEKNQRWENMPYAVPLTSRDKTRTLLH